MDWASHIGRIFSHLGEDATFTHAASTPASVKVMFLAPYKEITLGNAVIAGSMLRAVALTSVLTPSVANGDTLLRNGVTYVIRGIEPDDPGGFTVLQLSEP